MVKLKYIWNMKQISKKNPEFFSWLNQFVMENATELNGGPLGELWDIVDLDWTEEEAKHIKDQLNTLGIPVEIDDATMACVINTMEKFANDMDMIGKFEAANKVDMFLKQIGRKLV